MAKKKATDAEIIAAWQRLGSPTLVAREFGMGVATLFRRRNAIEAKGIPLPTWNDTSDRGAKERRKDYQGRIDLEIDNGVVVVFSDAHFWPGFKTTANRALIAMLRQLKPAAVICNGDAFDGATISRFPRPFFDEGKPSVMDELRVCQERLTEIAGAAGAQARKVWALGNHDTRYEARLAAHAPEFQGVKGFHLKDWFPEWAPAWSCWINEDVEVRHRYRNGIHATHTNVMANHHTTVCGHLHSLKVAPYTDGRGIIKYGVDTGCLADPDGPQFTDYLEGRMPNWRSGFVVLTFRNGRLLMPEVVMKCDEDHVEFRGHVLHADTLEVAGAHMA